MKSINTFSLSLQKQIQNQNVSIDTEINRVFQELKFRSLLKRSAPAVGKSARKRWTKRPIHCCR
jgi:hypothetical protein